MDRPQPSASAKGKRRALDLGDISTAILNLPTDSSALLPTPALSAHFSGFPGSSSNTHPTIAAESTNDAHQAAVLPCQSPSDDVYKRAVDHIIQRTKSRVEHEIARGRTTLERFEASVDQRKNACGLGTESGSHGSSQNTQKSPAERLEDALGTLKQVWNARAARPHEAINSVGNIAVDKASVQVFTQGLVPLQNKDGGLSLPSYIPCQPGTVMSWTKYFKGIQVAASKSPEQQPTDLPVTGQKRRHRDLRDSDLPPAEKRRIISLTESASQVNTFQFQHLLLTDDNAQARASTRPGIGSFDLVSSISSCPDLIFYVCQYLSLKDIMALYCVSQIFKVTFDSNLKSNVLHLARRFASPDTISIFPWALYKKATVELPPTQDGLVHAPSLRYVNMLVSRQRKTRDIIACLARAGHRLPRSCAASALKKMWLLMDIPTNRGRAAFMRNEKLFTDEDLLVLQMFRVKLEMHFTNPLRGSFLSPPNPSTEAVAGAGEQSQREYRSQYSLVEALLGQRSGLHVLWCMLRGKEFRTAKEVVELKVRYDYIPSTLFYSDDDESEQEHLLRDSPWSNDIDGLLDSSLGNTPTPTADHGGRALDGDLDSAGLPVKPRFSLDLSPELEQTLSDIAKDHNNRVRRRALEDAIYAVPVWEMGVGHLEGWGLGTQHLLRPDELVTLEASRRRRNNPENSLDLEKHLPFMPVWGARDFDSGRNLVPSIDEMYMSDNEDDAWLEGYDKPKPSISAIIAADDGDIFCSAEGRLSRSCGSVPLKHSDWQPWQVLKDRWDTLPRQEKLDVWWMNLQERLRRHGWSYRSAIDDNRGDQASYEEAVDDAEDEDYGPDADESYNDNSDNFVFSVPGSTHTSAAFPAGSGTSQDTDSENVAPSLSTRHRNIVHASIAWALHEQDEVDAALLAQSEIPYEEEELQHWDQFLTDVGPDLEDDDDNDEGNESSGSGGVNANNDEMGDGHGSTANISDDEHSEASSQQPPSPEAVLMPEYGCPKEVMRLARQTYNAEVALRAAETGSATIRQQAELAASAAHLRRKLDAVIRGEVYAIEL